MLSFTQPSCEMRFPKKIFSKFSHCHTVQPDLRTLVSQKRHISDELPDSLIDSVGAQGLSEPILYSRVTGLLCNAPPLKILSQPAPCLISLNITGPLWNGSQAEPLENSATTLRISETLCLKILTVITPLISHNYFSTKQSKFSFCSRMNKMVSNII